MDAADKLIRGFLWRKMKNPFYIELNCNPKKEGELGLRNMHDIVQASPIKLAWTIHNESGI